MQRLYYIQGEVKIIGWLIFLFQSLARIKIVPSWHWCLPLKSASRRNLGLTTKQEIRIYRDTFCFPHCRFPSLFEILKIWVPLLLLKGGHTMDGFRVGLDMGLNRSKVFRYRDGAWTSTSSVEHIATNRSYNHHSTHLALDGWNGGCDFGL